MKAKCHEGNDCHRRNEYLTHFYDLNAEMVLFFVRPRKSSGFSRLICREEPWHITSKVESKKIILV